MRLAELVETPDRFFGDDDRPYQQGDIVLAPIARVQTDAAQVAQWRSFDQHQLSVTADADELLDVVLHVGYGPVMIVTHDCQLDREFLAEVTRLRRENRRLSLADAEQQAEDDPLLDRFVQVCPIVPSSAYRTQWATIASGQTIGLFPVPANESRGLSEDSVVDIGYRGTIDRHTIRARLAVLADETRAMLRYALARYDVFRTPEIGFDLEAAVGKRIRAVLANATSPLHVTLELSDGTSLELLQPPAEIRTDGPMRTTPPEAIADDEE